MLTDAEVGSLSNGLSDDELRELYRFLFETNAGRDTPPICLRVWLAR